MNNLFALAECRRTVLWTSIAVAIYGRQGYLNRVRIQYQ